MLAMSQEEGQGTYLINASALDVVSTMLADEITNRLCSVYSAIREDHSAMCV